MIIESAGLADIPVLCRHHRKMFLEMWALKGLSIDDARVQAVEAAYREKLEQEMPDGRCRAWVAKTDRQIIASGAMSLVSLVPVPGDLNRFVAYLHSIYTDSSHRHRQCARKVVERAIRECRALGIRRVLLNASDAGRRIYEQAGFCALPDAMRLFLDDDDDG
jgi:GNAT superfamily N-acetyltransferase